ncbi:MAG: transketolase [bacterium]|nr:transketolase [bacterium]
MVERGFDATDQLCINTIRTLSMDAVQAANSGHPGTPMALAPVAYLLYTKFLKHSPQNPAWFDRDRFVLSCGHASMLLYSTLYLAGYELSLDDLKAFRQWGSKTAGHPEYGFIPGVEITTGPLGQGCSSSVGMAFAEAHLGARFNREDHRIVDHRTWVLCGDGDLMEGVTYEAASLAGHLGLGKLTWIWDDNRITIEGKTDLTVSEDVAKRFEACDWHVQTVSDANDLEALTAAMEEAVRVEDKPSLIAVRSRIAFGAPNKENTSDAHGAPLGEDEIRGAKKNYQWPTEAAFHVPDEALERCRDRVRGRGADLADWQGRVAAWAAAFPAEHEEWRRMCAGKLPEGWRQAHETQSDTETTMASRVASGKVLNSLSEQIPELVGGSADLAPSTKTLIASSGDVTRGAYGERNLRFGIREHGMAAMLNGMALHGGLRPYGATFLVFSDYMRPAIRLAALMKLNVIYVFTHDSIWVGEDGPTHQPIEHVLSLRTIPGLTVLRPGDATETEAAWLTALEGGRGPVALILSRQGLAPSGATRETTLRGVPQGAYVVREGGEQRPDLVLMASGSEVQLVVEAQRQLAEKGVSARTVSMPSWELFANQEPSYKEQILLDGVPRLAVEAGTTIGWDRWVGDTGDIIGIDRFGASAPGKVVAEKFGLTATAVVERALAMLKRN